MHSATYIVFVGNHRKWIGIRIGLYYFIKSLNENADSTSVLPVMNICTLILAILLGIIFYKEKLTKSNWIGFSLAILSIILLTLI